MLDLNIRQEVPKTFVRGQTLEFLMELPKTIPNNWFVSDSTGPGAVTTSLSANLHKIQNAGTGGLIGSLNPGWEPGTKATKIRFYVEPNVTKNWPLGLAEFDVVFTRHVPGQPTKTYRSLPVTFTIVDGVTQVIPA